MANYNRKFNFDEKHQRRNKIEQGIEWLYIKTFSIGENVASAIF